MLFAVLCTTVVYNDRYIQGAYNSGNPANHSEFVNSGKLREFKIFSGNLSDACCFFVTQCQSVNMVCFIFITFCV